MVNKYLNNNERIVYQSCSSVVLDNDPGFYAYLTNKRLIFLNRTGLFFKNDRLVDLLLKHVVGVNIIDEGLIFKKRYLHIRSSSSTIKLFGKKSDLHDLHKMLNQQII
jgi:hypothetical protein